MWDHVQSGRKPVYVRWRLKQHGSPNPITQRWLLDNSKNFLPTVPDYFGGKKNRLGQDLVQMARAPVSLAGR